MSDQRVFEWMLLSNIIILVLDVGTGALDGQNFEGAYTINLIVTVLYYAANPLMGFLYCIFCEIKLGTPQSKLKNRLLVYSAPVFMNLICCIINGFTPVFFILDSENLYVRGPLFFLSFSFSYILIFYIFFRVLHRVRAEEKYSRQRKSYWPLIAFPIPPIIGSILQVYLEGVSIIWVSTVISMLIIYVKIQNTQMSTDSLTGLYNRKQMMPYLDWKASGKNRKNDLYIILMDMDNLKYINDNYGHVSGDEALVDIAETIKGTVTKDDFAGRYGGDEFILIAERSSEDEIRELIGNIGCKLTQRSRIRNSQYSLSVSVGYALWQREYEDIKDIIAIADERMYQEKKKKGSAASLWPSTDFYQRRF
ncbi:MAG: GGDEF domain-containing protein [Clostridiales bacterium]|nr:GGDEF domain-containing protein [Clostridiales bacterium]